MSIHLWRGRILGVCLSLVLSSGIAHAQIPEALEGGKKAWMVFRDFLASVGVLVEAEKKDQLIWSLTKLNKDIYDLENNKRYVLESLASPRRDELRLNVGVRDLRESLDRARKTLREMGLLLRQQFKRGGEQVEADLLGTTGTRKIWVDRLEVALPTGRIDPALVEEGKRALEDLRKSNTELTKLIDVLREPRQSK